MDWKELAIGDKELFDRHFRARSPGLSDYTFTNLYIWHFSRRIRYALVNGFLCTEVTYRGQAPLALAPFGEGDPRACLEKLREDFHGCGLPLRFRALGAEMKQEIEQAWPGGFTFQEEPEHFDYVYRVKDLVELSGREYHDKRNHVNQFRMMYDYAYRALTGDLIDAVAGAQIRWCRRAECGDSPGLADENTGILEALGHFDRLGFAGGVLLVGGQVVAFTFGEALTADTVVIHIEKADTDFRGAYQMINQQFLERQWSHMTFVNREEDLGLAGLRKAKQSYNPIRMVEKFAAAESP